MPDKITLSFLGDISLNDQYRRMAEEGKDPFTQVAPVLEKSDLVIGNIEATCDAGDHFLPEKTILRTDPSTLKFLKTLNLGLACLANNHIYDNLEEGFSLTTSFLDANNINRIGAGKRESDETDHVVLEIKGIKIGLLSYVHASTHPKVPGNAPIRVDHYQREKILRDIQSRKPQSDILILLFHWGMENSFFPEPWQIRDAKAYIRAGANVIVGHHTHTLQGYQQFGKGLVFYSLGNFCFSPIISTDKTHVLDEKRHTESIILNIHIRKDNQMSFEAIPVKIDNTQVILGTPFILTKFERRSRLIPVVRIFYWIYKFYLLSLHKVYSYFFLNNRNPLDQLKKLNLGKVRKFIRQQKSIVKNG